MDGGTSSVNDRSFSATVDQHYNAETCYKSDTPLLVKNTRVRVAFLEFGPRFGLLWIRLMRHRYGPTVSKVRAHSVICVVRFAAERPTRIEDGGCPIELICFFERGSLSTFLTGGIAITVPILIISIPSSSKRALEIEPSLDCKNWRQWQYEQYFTHVILN